MGSVCSSRCSTNAIPGVLPPNFWPFPCWPPSGLCSTPRFVRERGHWSSNSLSPSSVLNYHRGNSISRKYPPGGQNVPKLAPIFRSVPSPPSPSIFHHIHQFPSISSLKFAISIPALWPSNFKVHIIHPFPSPFLLGQKILRPKIGSKVRGIGGGVKWPKWIAKNGLFPIFIHGDASPSPSYELILFAFDLTFLPSLDPFLFFRLGVSACKSPGTRCNR